MVHAIIAHRKSVKAVYPCGMVPVSLLLDKLKALREGRQVQCTRCYRTRDDYMNTFHANALVDAHAFACLWYVLHLGQHGKARRDGVDGKVISSQEQFSGKTRGEHSRQHTDSGRRRRGCTMRKSCALTLNVLRCASCFKRSLFRSIGTAA